MKYVDPKTVKLIDLVRDHKKVRFSFYRDKEFWFEHEDGLLFPIPLSDIESPVCKVTLPAEEKAIFFMRWIRKYIDASKVESLRDIESCKTPINNQEVTDGPPNNF